jgi:hypothetical protein
MADLPLNPSSALNPAFLLDPKGLDLFGIHPQQLSVDVGQTMLPSNRDLLSFSGERQQPIMFMPSPVVGDRRRTGSQDDLTGHNPQLPWVQADATAILQSSDHSLNLGRAIAQVRGNLQQFMASPEFLNQLQMAFGTQWNPEAAQQLLEQLSTQLFTERSPIALEVLDQAGNGTEAAFAAQTNTIYVFEDFLVRHADDVGAIARVLLEEVGHYIDAQLNAVDSPGDEGQLFAALVQGESIDVSEFQRLKSEDDHAFFVRDGQHVLIEQSYQFERLTGAVNGRALRSSDFDGDGIADLVTAHYDAAGQAHWTILTSKSQWQTSIKRQLGIRGDVLVPKSDFDKDGKTDMAVWRPNARTWFVRTSGKQWNDLSAYRMKGIVRSGDTVIHDADFNGDGKTDLALSQPSSGTWTFLSSRKNWKDGLSFSSSLGAESPPVWTHQLQSANFGDDGRFAQRTDMVAFDQSSGRLRLLLSSKNWNPMTVPAGMRGKLISTSDFDGDRKSDIAVVNKVGWQILLSSKNWRNPQVILNMPTNGTPLVGDFNGDQKTDLAVRHKDARNWTIGLSSISSQSGKYSISPVSLTWGEPGETIASPSDFNNDGRADLVTWHLNRGRFSVALTTPNIKLGLANDTGASRSDKITADSTIRGQVSSVAKIVQLKAGFEGAPDNRSVDMTSAIQPDGSFQFSDDQLKQIYGGSLKEGTNTLKIAVSNELGNIKASQFSFTLDTKASLQAEPRFKTPSVRLGETIDDKVTFVGKAEANSTVVFQKPDSAAQAVAVDASGNFEIKDVALAAIGDYQFSLQMRDVAGNTTSKSLNVKRIVDPSNQLSAALVKDTAANNTTNGDRITSDPQISGILKLTGQNVRLLANFGTLTDSNGIDITPTIDSQGRYTLDLAALKKVNGGKELTDGQYVLSLQAKNDQNQKSPLVTVSFGLDTKTTAQLGLAAAFMALPDRKDLTSQELVTLEGLAEVGATVELQQQVGTQTKTLNLTPDATGKIQANNVKLAQGKNAFTLKVIDAAGNQIVQLFSVTRSNPAIHQMTAALKRDTGTSNSDRLTSDPTIKGKLKLTEWRSPSSIQILASFGTLDDATAKVITASVDTNGEFTIERSSLASLNNGKLPDGSYTLSIQAIDGSGDVSSIVKVAFTLDATAPNLVVRSLIDGIRWNSSGERLKGQVNNYQTGTTLTYQIDEGERIDISTRTGTFDIVLDRLAELAEGEHKLTIHSADAAGNEAVPLVYQFFITPDPVATDDIWEIIPPPDSPPTQPPSGSSGGSAGSWLGNYYSGGGGGGGGGSYYWGNGSPNNPTAPSGDSPPPPNAPNIPPLTYLEKVSIILDQAVKQLPTPPNTRPSEKATLTNRIAVLMSIADMIHGERLYDQMDTVLHDIYDAAADSVNSRAEAVAWGSQLAGKILASGKGLKEAIYHAELVAAIQQVLADDNKTPQSKEAQDKLVKSLENLASVYVGFSANRTAVTDRSSSAPPDFLDALWQAQNTKDASLAKTEMQRGVQSLDKLLTGIENPLPAIQFVSQLVQSAKDTASLRFSGAMTDGPFLQELAIFGFQYAKLNPIQVDLSKPDAASNVFMAALWQEPVSLATTPPVPSAELRTAIGKLNDVFSGVNTPAERLQLIQFETRILKSVGQISTSDKRDPEFISSLVELGGTYASFKFNNTNPPGTSLDFFLNTLWTDTSDAGMTRAATELSNFLK